MNYAVFLITSNGVDQQVTNSISFQDAHDMAGQLQAESFLEDIEFVGDVFGNFVVMPCSIPNTSCGNCENCVAWEASETKFACLLFMDPISDNTFIHNCKGFSRKKNDQQ